LGPLVGESGRIIVARLMPKEDIVKGTIRTAMEAKVESSVFSIIGTLRKARLGFFLGKGQYKPIEFNESLEIVSLVGNTSKKDGEVTVHAHMVVADSEGKAYGGHVMDGCLIDATGELVMIELQDIQLRRKPDVATGLNLLDL